MKWNRRATLVDLGGLHCYKLFTCEYHRRPPSSSSSLTIISWFSVIFQTDVMMWTTLHEDRRSYSSQSPAPGVWGRTATSPSVLTDTKSTNTGEGLLWGSFLPCKTQAIPPWLQDPFTIHGKAAQEEEPCLEQGVVLSPLSKCCLRLKNSQLFPAWAAPTPPNQEYPSLTFPGTSSLCSPCWVFSF